MIPFSYLHQASPVPPDFSDLSSVSLLLLQGVDYSINSFTPTVFGSPSQQDLGGIPGTWFQTSSDWYRFNNNTALVGTNTGFTIEAFYYFNNASGGTIGEVQKYTLASWPNDPVFDEVGGLRYKGAWGSSYHLGSTFYNAPNFYDRQTTVNPGSTFVWRHVCIQQAAGSTVAYLHVDGQLIASYNQGSYLWSNSTSQQLLAIGARNAQYAKIGLGIVRISKKQQYPLTNFAPPSQT